MKVAVKQFKAKFLSLGTTDSARQNALEFINKELKPEQIISITESVAFGKEFSVAVWYKKE